MSFSSKVLIPLCAAGAFASAGMAQPAPPAPKSQLTPRELFYSAGPAPDDAHSHKATSKGQAAQGSKGHAPKGNPDAVTHGGPDLPGGGHIVNASAGPPIGITYTLQKAIGDAMVAVSPDAVFHDKDKINFVVQTNYEGYLYIGSKGPSGGWTPLFPSPEIEDGANQVKAFHKYTMPRRRIEFTPPAGVESVFILFSRQPVSDFEKLLYNEQGGSGTPKSGDGKSASKPASIAKADIPDSLVDRLRSAYSRDLVLEKIDEDKPGNGKEKAVYVVNPTGSADSHVWADLKLVHK